MNFFVQALNDPNIIVNFLSVYRDPFIDIEKEIIQLVYYAKLSYYDVQLMTFNTRRLWIHEVKKIIEEANKNPNEINF